MGILDDDELARAEAADPPANEEEFAALMRTYIGQSLNELAKLTLSNNPAVAQEASEAIEGALLRLKQDIENPATPESVRRELEIELRKFRRS
jgi:hypothetical protein